jgi:hypothetical protein
MTALSAAETASQRPRTLLIACGALARELLDLIQRERWDHMELSCLPAKWHNTPGKIPEAVRAKIRAARETHDRIFVMYADCGTGGALDRVLTEEGVERLPGPHCYATYMGQQAFARMADDDPTAFYLTDFLVRHFDRLVIESLGLDRHPELTEMYFGNYTKVVYLAQRDDPVLQAKAREAAERLGLAYEYHHAGYGELETFLHRAGDAGRT